MKRETTNFAGRWGAKIRSCWSKKTVEENKTGAHLYRFTAHLSRFAARHTMRSMRGFWDYSGVGIHIMNNDAKDLIGQLRAVNLILVLLQIKQFDFPLDDAIRRLLIEHQRRFHQMVQIVSDLANFEAMRGELLSSLDDILDLESPGYYTQDYLDTLLFLYRGQRELVHPNYTDPLSLRAFLTETCRSKIHDLSHSIMWLRVAFSSYYPDVVLPSLNQGWRAFCTIATDIGRLSFENGGCLFISSLRSWRFSETVVAALEKVNVGGMPHEAAFFKAVQEVDDCLNA